MDTKSTKIHNSKLFKIILVVLSALLVFYGTFTFENLYAFYETKGSSIIELNKNKSILGSGNTAFATEIKEDVNRVVKLATIYKNDEAVSNGSAFEYRQGLIEMKTQREIQRQILEDKLDAIDNMYVYDYENEYYTYPYAPIDQSLILPNFSSESQEFADERSDTNSGRGITTVNGIDYYKGYPIDKVETDEAVIKSSYEEQMQAQIVSERAEFRADYKNIKKHLSQLNNFQYYVVDIEAGTVYTNMQVDSIEQAAENMSGYAAYIKSGDLCVSDEVTEMIENSGGTYYNYSGDSLYDSNYYHAVFTGETKIDINKYDVYIHVNTDGKTLLPNDEYFDLYNAYQKQASELSKNIAIFVTCAVICLICLILLINLAGNKDEEGNIKLAKIDKIPNSIHLAVSGVAVGLLVALTLSLFFDHANYNQKNFTLFCMLSSLPMAGAMVFFEEWLMSTSRQVKCHKYFKNTLIGLFVVPACRRLRKWWNSEDNRFMSKSIKRRVLFPLIAYAIIMPVCCCLYFIADSFFIIIAAVITVLMLIYIIKFTIGLASIDSALMDAEKGDFNYNIEVDEIPVSIRSLGRRTNNLTKGMKAAIDDAVRNERMKTELITNVSHDLKTPLTSIITYTDLLKMCNIEDPKAREYISVLDEKSARLKKLIEDLVEASKASSGNVKLVLADININEMVEQVYGEYEDDLSSANLNLRCNFPNTPVVAIADGQKTYRVIENLFSNVKKYAMPGTRVYLDVTSDDRFAIIDMKNISRDEMCFEVSNLAERFVRGDESRSTEGSGLGLSIAKSLTELQGGCFEISTDGDLFKVVIKLPLSKTSTLLIGEENPKAEEVKKVEDTIID